MPKLELWQWEVRDPLTGRWRKTRYHMTEAEACQRYSADARKLEWTREVRDGDPEANSTSAFQRKGVGGVSR